jgi:O-antigen ligase
MRRTFVTVVATVMSLGLAAVVGYALAALGVVTGGGPALVVILPLLVLGASLVLRDPRLGVIAVFLSLPIGFSGVPGLPIQLVEAAVVGAAVLVALHRIGVGLPPLSWAAPLGWVLALICWLLILYPSAIDSELASRQTAQIVGGLLFACTVLAAVPRARDVRMVMAVFVGVAALIAALSIGTVQNLQSRFGGSYVQGRATGIFSEGNQLGALCSLAALVAIGLTMTARRPATRVAGIVSTATLVVSMLLSLSRGSWIGFVVGVLVLAVMVRRARRALLIGIVPLLVVAALAGALAPSSPAVTVVSQRLGSTLGERNPYDKRPAIWAEALREIRTKPLTGVGAGGFPKASARVGSKAETVAAEHAHDVLLTWAAEAGILAALMIIGFGVHVVVVVRHAARRLRRDRRRDHELLASLAAAAAAVAGQGVVDYVLRSSVVFFAMWGVLGALLVMVRAGEQALALPEPRARNARAAS